MKVIVGTQQATSANMVRGAIQIAKAENTQVVHITKAGDLAKEIGPDAVLLIDWEDGDMIAGTFASARKSAAEGLPLIVLCPKAKAGTIPASLGATVLSKPIQPAELIAALQTALKPAKGAPIQVEFINPFIEATKNTFETMCQTKIERKKLYLKTDYKMLGDISGVMGLSGSASGSVVISLPGKLACLVVGRMLGEPPKDSLNQDVCDALGELINMISGQAKASLSSTKYQFTISLPSVVMGPGHEIMHKKGTPNIVVMFETDGFEFAIQVCLGQSEAAG